MGGVLGNTAKATIVAVIVFVKYQRFDGSALFFAILGIPSAALVGVIIAMILRLIARKVRTGIVARTTAGGCLVLAMGVIAYFGGVSNWSADDISTWMLASLFYLDFGFLTGAIAGLLAGAKTIAASRN